MPSGMLGERKLEGLRHRLGISLPRPSGQALPPFHVLLVQENDKLMARLQMIMTWDIRPGHEQEYSEFINDRLAPGLVEIGIPPSDVYYTAYGAVPQIMAVLDVPDGSTLRKALRSKRWADLKRDLLNFIENYQERIVFTEPGGYF